MDAEDLQVYRMLCQLHIDVCDLTHDWPLEKKYELGSQVRRSSNSAPAQLAEKNDDRHIRNKIEGVNRSRGEAAETIHHLYMAKLKGYITKNIYLEFRGRYKEENTCPYYFLLFFELPYKSICRAPPEGK